MKKILTTLCCLFIMQTAFSQVLKCKIRYDKYGDIVAYDECRATIRNIGSYFEIEEKGKGRFIYQRAGDTIENGSNKKGFCISPDNSIWIWIEEYKSNPQNSYEKGRIFMLQRVEGDDMEVQETIMYKENYDPELAEYVRNKNRR